MNVWYYAHSILMNSLQKTRLKSTERYLQNFYYGERNWAECTECMRLRITGNLQRERNSQNEWWGESKSLSVRVCAGVALWIPRWWTSRSLLSLSRSSHVVVHHVAVAVDIPVVVVVLRVEEGLGDVLLGVVGWRGPSSPAVGRRLSSCTAVSTYIVWQVIIITELNLAVT